MTAKELIDALANYHPDAEVILVSQSHYPLENSLAGVVSRREALDADRDEADADEEDADDTDGAERQVLLVEGEHLGYGIRGAWRAVRR
jgi:hypothetical protein